MNIFNKIKNIFRKKQDLSSNKKILSNDKKIQHFFNKNSGWRRESFSYFFEKGVRPKSGTIKAYASFSREATPEEVEANNNRKILCEIEQREHLTLDNIWKDALKEIEEHGELQERITQRVWKEEKDYTD